MDDDATAVKQRLSAGGVMRRLVAGDYAVDAVTMAKALVGGAWDFRNTGERGGRGGRLSSRAVERIGCVIFPED